MGSKSRIAKYIVPIIQRYIDENNIEKYVEPFVGGANVIDKVQCKEKYGFDKNKYLIALLKRVQNGEELYDEVPKEMYDKARAAFNAGDTSEYEDWEIGNIGFLASYNGRWFDGGYAKLIYEKTKNGTRLRDYYREAKDNVIEQAPKLKNIQFYVSDYKDSIELPYDEGMVIYCDPPYMGVKKYANALSFDYNEFWQTMREWSKCNIVLISEHEAPSDFECIWEQSVNRTIDNTKRVKTVEKLFIYKGGVQ